MWHTHRDLKAILAANEICDKEVWGECHETTRLRRCLGGEVQQRPVPVQPEIPDDTHTTHLWDTHTVDCFLRDLGRNRNTVRMEKQKPFDTPTACVRRYVANVAKRDRRKQIKILELLSPFFLASFWPMTAVSNG